MSSRCRRRFSPACWLAAFTLCLTANACSSQGGSSAGGGGAGNGGKPGGASGGIGGTNTGGASGGRGGGGTNAGGTSIGGASSGKGGGGTGAGGGIGGTSTGAAGSGTGAGGRTTGGAGAGGGGRSGGAGGMASGGRGGLASGGMAGSGSGGAGGRTCGSTDARCTGTVWCGTACCGGGEWCDSTVAPPICRCGGGGDVSCTGSNGCQPVGGIVKAGGCGDLCCGGSMSCPVSRRSAKRDIQAVGHGELQALYDQLRAIQLATYSYKVAPPESPRRLGFIIDDTNAPAAINPDGNSVDLYGYLSMAVAAVQVQARELESLRARLHALERARSGTATPERAHKR